MSSKTDDGHSHGWFVAETVERTTQAHGNRAGKEGGKQQKQSCYLIGEGT